MIRGGSNEAWLLNWIRIPNGFADNPLEGILRCTYLIPQQKGGRLQKKETTVSWPII